jgi:hypothetical protein
MKVPETQENKSKCQCVKGCPTYDKSGLTGVLYCSTGKSKETPKRSGCYCPGCEVWAAYNLDRTYYCDTEAAQ